MREHAKRYADGWGKPPTVWPPADVVTKAKAKPKPKPH
jgi:hypothetical protein